MTRWHRWFAWRPVRTDDYRWTWLRMIERHRVWSRSDIDPMCSWWEYRRHDGYVA